MKKQNSKFIRLTEAAQMIGVSTKTLLRNRYFRVVKLDPTKTTSPNMVERAEVIKFINRLLENSRR